MLKLGDIINNQSPLIIPFGLSLNFHFFQFVSEDFDSAFFFQSHYFIPILVVNADQLFASESSVRESQSREIKFFPGAKIFFALDALIKVINGSDSQSGMRKYK